MIVVTSDWHADHITDGFPRYDDIETQVQRIVDHTIRSHAKYFFFLGDLTNPYSKFVHRATSLATYVDTQLAAKGVRRVWLVGNHDICGDEFDTHTLLSLANLPRTVVADQPGIFDYPEFTLVCLPFTPLNRDYDPEEFVRGLYIRDTKPVIFIGHLNIDGIEPGSETLDMPRGRNVFLPYKTIQELYPDALILNGHYHKRQTFRGVHIPGTPCLLAHGEETNEPGFLTIRNLEP